MATITFNGVSPRSLGDLLKGYGLMALIGEQWPETVFYWDDAGHLVAKSASQTNGWTRAVTNHIGASLPSKAREIGSAFQRNNGQSALANQIDFDKFSPTIAIHAWAAAIPDSSDGRAPNGHPWFPAYGQDGRGNYFATLNNLKLFGGKGHAVTSGALTWSLFHDPAAKIEQKLRLKSGGVFFPEPMKRYATGVSNWIREGDAPASQWCYALALYGALSLRGSLRRMRFARSNYPSFPFVFEGANAWEVHLPVWSDKHPRTLREWRMQLAQFQVRVKGDALASNAVEFRAAIASRGVAAAFDRFHRFVLEERRPGQQQYLQQGILRGITQVGAADTIDIRLLVAPLAERRWLDRLETKRRLPRKPNSEQLKRLECRVRIEQAIHAAIDEPRPQTALEILRALWEANQVLARQAKQGGDEAGPKVPSPVPLLDAAAWDQALRPLLQQSTEHRIARAIGSILGVREGGDGQPPQETDDGNTAASVEPRDATKHVGGLLWQFLPIDANHAWSKERGASVLAWRGAAPEQEFSELLWRRWLCSLGAGMRHLAIRGRRTASLADLVQLLNGELDFKLIHELVPLYALLDWRGFQPKESSGSFADDETPGPIPPAYAVLRAWLHLAIYPGDDNPVERDGGVLRLLATLNAAQANRAVSRALHRLRIRGLPTTDEENRPFGKSVPQAQVEIPSELARRLPLALLVPIGSNDTHSLARRLLVQSPNHEATETTA